VQILGVSFDSVEENAAFAEKYKFPFPLLCDTKREIGMAYGACDSAQADNAKRISYIIDPQGKIEQAFAKVNASKHPEELLEVIGSD
jgi:peroxiredoxin Q/BCP